LNELFLTQENAQTVFMATVNSLFADQVISWGRIIALLAFSGAVAAECDQVVLWTSSFVDQRLISWIQRNKGWVSKRQKSAELELQYFVPCH
jgi:Apoptosis regulator proteins, Bcl-2 family